MARRPTDSMWALLDNYHRLLEFTLMAKARERVAEEAHSAVEAEKSAWRDGETKRVEDEVRQEHAVLHNQATREDSALPVVKGSEAFDLVSSSGYISDWDGVSFRNLSTRHPALPPSAVGGYTSRFPARTDAAVEVVTNQMAGILRAVEAKVRRIEALKFDGSQSQENEESQHPDGGGFEQTKPPPGTRESLRALEEDKIADMMGDAMKETIVDANQTPMVSAPERSELAAELDGTRTTEGGIEVDPNIAYGTLPGRLVFPSEIPVFSNALYQSWLDGQTTLQQAGQCIGAELEVAMLCMQKRLGKEPIVYGEEGDITTVANQDDAAGKAVPRTTEILLEKAAPATVGSSFEHSFRENLQALADGMEARREQNTYNEAAWSSVKEESSGNVRRGGSIDTMQIDTMQMAVDSPLLAHGRG
eukprot:g10044.t1